MKIGMTAIAALAIVLATTGCQANATAGSVKPTQPAATGAQPQATTTTSAADVPAPQNPAGDGGDFCQLVKNTAIGLFAPGAGEPDAATVKDHLAKALAAAPAEIKPDLQAIADVELPIVNGQVPAEEIEQKLDDPKLQSAMHHYAEWINAHCGDVATGLPTG
jgi:hypothetical protein